MTYNFSRLRLMVRVAQWAVLVIGAVIAGCTFCVMLAMAINSGLQSPFWLGLLESSVIGIAFAVVWLLLAALSCIFTMTEHTMFQTKLLKAKDTP